MLQLLVWAACVLIFGIGYCGRYLEELVAIKRGAKTTTGLGFLILMIVLAAVIFTLSLLQGTVLSDILKR